VGGGGEGGGGGGGGEGGSEPFGVKGMVRRERRGEGRRPGKR